LFKGATNSRFVGRAAAREMQTVARAREKRMMGYWRCDIRFLG
jgi:hypothetical protein